MPEVPASEPHDEGRERLLDRRRTERGLRCASLLVEPSHTGPLRGFRCFNRAIFVGSRKILRCMPNDEIVASSLLQNCLASSCQSRGLKDKASRIVSISVRRIWPPNSPNDSVLFVRN